MAGASAGIIVGVTVRLLATDLDGTLLNSERSVSARTAAAMAAARAAGIEVVWASARARHSIHELAQSCGFTGKAIGANGAVVLDLADGTPVISGTTSIDATAVATAMKRVRDVVPGVVFATVGATRFVAEHGYAALCVFADHHRHPHEMDVRSTVLSDEPTVKIVARHPDVPSVELYRTVLAAEVDGVELTHSGAPYIEMSATGVSKASALARLCEELGIDRTAVAAVGDAFNDVPMLEWAGTALTTENAMLEIKEIADRILQSNDDDGVARYLEELTEDRAGHSTEGAPL
ncbi:Cof-type HAD-IIB family hydrolase [Rhodococcus sp. 06-156-3C]|uniref:Cof-type HAD-IIB family hydrolase n=1 Tax=Nocardiaceae TaxID=85025 RepID=UPI0005230907|nr:MULTISPECIES: Cof-type HAD-IIB family hydrolase [Rhodococcus]OZD14346.1 Cof-type HAD-IIB family hydrolase [Rhodococcus sp. 06-156-3C]OZD16036.1 Cof-type HAD-IIB family hydrolase [Rhodococcus sp. 06-156-4C]OZD24683.1 Cof-type HAD-IIB family hydrolase [Rhodococcus sp. 06-156-3b]OZD28638.1 Cof-type HAD-IIB family hydrolase [Rhodococcus sp. 06-156-4a]OZD36964.1 Cof-type HAD-IIB family hydrolase [Rhodococcus sp. 06-156-3]